MDKIDKRIKEAAELSLHQIELALPQDLLASLKSIGTNTSTPWLGLLIGMITPIQHSMGHSLVEMEDSDFEEPTISWTISHMPTGTRKSKIYKFINKIMEQAYKNVNFNINQATFERIGMDMTTNDNTGMWFFDEGRSFFSQISMYNKGSTRNEAALLSLYDGLKWAHRTTTSANFDMPFTKLTIGGFTQTAHMLDLQSSKDGNESGFIPRFLTFLLKPVATDVRQTTAVPREVIDYLVNVLGHIKVYHEDAKKEQKRKYVVERGTSAFELFCRYTNTLNAWILENYYIRRLERARGMVSKSIGQVLRLSAILNSFFLFANCLSVQQFENTSPLSQVCPDFVARITGPHLPISLMAMEAAIQIVTFSLHQNFILQGIQFIEINCQNGNVNLQSTQTEETSQTAPTSSRRVVVPTMNDEGKLLSLHGMTMNVKRINIDKKLGRAQGQRLSKVMDVFRNLQSEGFGILSEEVFVFHADIINRVDYNEVMLEYILSCGVSMTKFRDARKAPSIYASRYKQRNPDVPVPEKKVKASAASPSATATSSVAVLHQSPVVNITFMGHANASISPNTLTAFHMVPSSNDQNVAMPTQDHASFMRNEQILEDSDEDDFQR